MTNRLCAVVVPSSAPAYLIQKDNIDEFIIFQLPGKGAEDKLRQALNGQIRYLI